MKKKKRGFLILLTLLGLCFSNWINVYAQSNMTIDSKTYIYTDSRKEAKFYTNKGYAYCITPSKTGGPQGTTLVYKSSTTSGGVLYLLENAGTSDNDYLATQLAIWKYDGNYMPEFYQNRSNYDVVRRANALATAAYNNRNYSSPKASVKITTSSTKWNETSDKKNFKSDALSVTIANAGNANLTLTSAPSGAKIVDLYGNTISMVANGGKFYILIPQSSVTSKTTMTVKATVTGSTSSVERYAPSSGNWQELVVLVKTPTTATDSTSLSLSPIKRTCEVVNGVYYDKEGNVVDHTTYSIQCERHVCEKVGNTYFGSNGEKVNAEDYSIQCERHVCEKVGNTYFGSDGEKVNAEEYSLQCEKHICEKVGNTYFGSNGEKVSYSDYNIQCLKHTCEIINGYYFGINSTIVTQNEYTIQCIHTCEIYNNQYYGKQNNLQLIRVQRIIPIKDQQAGRG